VRLGHMPARPPATGAELGGLTSGNGRDFTCPGAGHELAAGYCGGVRIAGVQQPMGTLPSCSLAEGNPLYWLARLAARVR
jgi:hypothetical protein